MYKGDLPDKEALAEDLREFEDDVKDITRRFGLHAPNERETQYWIVDYEEMNELAAYQGFPDRFPHWRWGISYLQQRNSPGTIFEMVIDDDIAETYLQESNTLADQKAVMAHVEAGHADFFANNDVFQTEGAINAVQMMRKNRKKIQELDRDPDIDRFEREYLTDTMLALQQNIDPVRTMREIAEESDDPELEADIEEALEHMGISEDEIGSYKAELEDLIDIPEEDAPDTMWERDLMHVLKENGQVYDEEQGEAVDMEDWHKEVIDIHRQEAYYFKKTPLTKTMNEGWSAYWESMLLGNEGMADIDEIWTYAEHQALVLNSPGYNPYKIGKDLWEYVENEANREEVVEKLLQTTFIDEDGNEVNVTPDNFWNVLDYGEIMEGLEPDEFVDSVTSHSIDELLAIDSEKIDHETLEALKENDAEDVLYEKPWKALTYDGLADRHFSLLRRQNMDFLKNISEEELESIYHTIGDDERYTSIDEAIDAVDKTAGWEKMFEVRETHNDLTFFNEYVTDEWAKRNEYSATETLEAAQDYDWVGQLDVVTSHDVDDIKKKFLVMFNNFGKPAVAAYDTNYDNKGELVLVNDYNGYEMDREQAKRVNEMVFDHYGKPVNLVTVEKDKADEEYQEKLLDAKEEVLMAQYYEDYEADIEWPVPEEEAVRLRYDGDDHEEHTVTRGEMRDQGWEPFLTSDHPYQTVSEEWLEDGYEDKWLTEV